MYTNSHLKEVLCTYKFVPGQTKWDSAFFGQFYDKISDAGFTERQEKKGIIFEINGTEKKGTDAILPNVQEAESQMIFRNPTQNFAITMGNSMLSFHIVSTYENWEVFNEKLMAPFIEKYIELSIYDKIQSCQVVYLNQFELAEDQKLSDYFTVVSPPFEEFGKETSVQVTKKYTTSNGAVLILRISPQNKQPSTSKTITLECGANGNIANGIDIREWKTVSQNIKNPIKNFFECIITEKLRQSL